MTTATIHAYNLTDGSTIDDGSGSMVYDVLVSENNKEFTTIKCIDRATAERIYDKYNKPAAKTRAEIQAAYRERLKANGDRVSRTFYIDLANIDHLQAFLLSKHTGQGQFSSKQNEELSDVVNRALAQFFRKR